MLGSNLSSKNSYIVGGALNPSFFGVQTISTSTTQEKVLITPPPYSKSVEVQPPSYTTETEVQPPAITVQVDGQSVTVLPPPVKIPVQVNPPKLVTSVQVTPEPYFETVNIGGKTTLVNRFPFVGVVQTWPYRLTSLVSKPNLIAGAKHYSIPVGSAVRFYNGTTYEEARVQSVAFSGYDLEIYRLDRNIVSVKPAPIYDNPNLAQYLNRKIVTFGLVGDRRPPYGSWTPVAAEGQTVNFSGQPIPDRALVCKFLDGTQTQEGDSGAPSFIEDNGEYKFLGTNWKLTSGYSINLAVPRAALINSL